MRKSDVSAEAPDLKTTAARLAKAEDSESGRGVWIRTPRPARCPEERAPPPTSCAYSVPKSSDVDPYSPNSY
jgi:hypothetical protein